MREYDIEDENEFSENEDVDYSEQKTINSISSEEQEVHIWIMRNEKYAKIYTSDTTYMTKLDKMCKNSPDMYSLTADTGRGKTYRVEDKTLISFRSKKKEMSEEAKSAASERFSKLHAEGKIGRKKKTEE